MLLYLSLLAEEGVTLHGVVGVGRDEVEHVVVGRIGRAVGYPKNKQSKNKR